MSDRETMHGFQESGHGPGHDYERGSPHLKHVELRDWIVSTVVDTVRSVARDGRVPRVLEVGAGHGSLTEHLVAAGAEVVVTEMSVHSAEALRERFVGVDAVSVVHDPDGELAGAGDVDAVVYLSVLHHIPDYLDAVSKAADLVRAGGALVSFQDPLWYPRQRRTSLIAAKVVYLAWRLAQGELVRGAATTVRRLRGVYDESSPSDMVEYHVVRQGVDDEALERLLGERFADVRVHPYWSTQSSWGQRLGRRLIAPNTFGLVATGRVRSR